MSVTFFIGEQRLKTKIGLASICLLGLATSHVAANETEVAKTSQDTTTASSSSEQNQSSNKTQTSAEVQTNAAAHWDGPIPVGSSISLYFCARLRFIRRLILL